MLAFRNSLHLKYMNLLTDAIEGAQGYPDQDIQNWVAGARTLSDSMAILMSLGCLEAMLINKSSQGPEIISSAESELGQTTTARNENRDSGVPAIGDFIGDRRAHDSCVDLTPVDPEGDTSNNTDANKSEETRSADLAEECSITAPALNLGGNTSSYVTPSPEGNLTTPSRAPPSGRPFLHHPWTPRPTPQGLRREHAFTHKSHFEIAWVPEFGTIAPHTVEEALPAHYFEAEAPVDTVESSHSPVSPSASASSGDHDSGDREGSLHETTDANDSSLFVLEPQNTLREGTSQSHHTRSMAPVNEPPPPLIRVEKRKRNRDGESNGDVEPPFTRRTRSKCDDA